ncbi:hypothetical protein TELCIR_18040, partial [Teladorsagia circumcincta]
MQRKCIVAQVEKKAKKETQGRRSISFEPFLFAFWGGSLAFWARQKYPKLIAAAVGSSALLQPRVDFWESTQFVENVYRAYDKKCAENIQIGFAQMIDMLGTKVGRDQLSELF